MAAKKSPRSDSPAPSRKKASATASPKKADTPSKSRTPSSRKPPADLHQAAYFIYLQRLASGAPGDALGDWLAAETAASTPPRTKRRSEK